MARYTSPRKGAWSVLHGTSLQGMAVLGGAVLLGSTFLSSLSSPVSAQTVDELKAQIAELSQRVEDIETKKIAIPVIAPAQAVVAGDQPRSIKLPGTNTSFNVGGYVQLNALWTQKTPAGANSPHGGTPGTGGIPLDSALIEDRGGDTLLEAQQSRFWLKTWTPSDLGQVRTYLSGDFNGSPYGTSTNLRLRHAYGTVGNFLFGQTWEVFSTGVATPGTIDFNGPDGIRFTSRRAQVRYTLPFTGGNFQVSVQQTGGATFLGGLPAGASHIRRLPTASAKATVSGDWGTAFLAGMLREIRSDGAAGVSTDNTEGWGINIGTRIKTFGKASIAGAFVFGEGITGTVEVTPTGKLSAREEFGVVISYEHWWQDNLLSTIAYGRNEFTNDTAISPTAVESVFSIHANLIWIAVPRVQFGVEWFLRDFDTEDADQGDLQRVQLMDKFSF